MILFNLLSKICCIKWRYLFSGSIVYVSKNSTLRIGKGVSIKHSKIHLDNCSKMVIGDGVHIDNTIFAINNGDVNIGDNSFFSNGTMPTRQRIIICDGKISYGAFNRIRAELTWIRFGGSFSLGSYVNINEYSEIRSDESISIGNYVEISYHVIIWDTNTHELECKRLRRQRWERMYLNRDVAVKPKTKAVVIGNDTWIGRNVCILKGTKIGNCSICGMGVVLSAKEVPANTTIVPSYSYKVFVNKM